MSGMPKRRVAQRNRVIFTTWESGTDTKVLALEYGLKQSTVEDIIRAERHKVLVSPKAFYRKLRNK